MEKHVQADPAPNRRDRLENGFVLLGLVCAGVLTLGWWTAIAVGVFYAVG